MALNRMRFLVKPDVELEVHDDSEFPYWNLTYWQLFCLESLNLPIWARG